MGWSKNLRTVVTIAGEHLRVRVGVRVGVRIRVAVRVKVRVRVSNEEAATHE